MTKTPTKHCQTTGAAILLTPSSRKRAAEYPVVPLVLPPVSHSVQSDCNESNWLVIERRRNQNANGNCSCCSPSPDWSAVISSPSPLTRTPWRKMSNPQSGLLNHGNIYGTVSFPAESKCCLQSLSEVTGISRGV